MENASIIKVSLIHLNIIKIESFREPMIVVETWYEKCSRGILY
jgi:hypothetical protein